MASAGEVVAGARLALRGNAYDFAAHSQLLAGLKASGDAAALQAAREEFCARLAVPEGECGVA